MRFVVAFADHGGIRREISNLRPFFNLLEFVRAPFFHFGLKLDFEYRAI